MAPYCDVAVEPCMRRTANLVRKSSPSISSPQLSASLGIMFPPLLHLSSLTLPPKSPTKDEFQVREQRQCTVMLVYSGEDKRKTPFSRYSTAALGLPDISRTPNRAAFHLRKYTSANNITASPTLAPELSETESETPKLCVLQI